MSAPLPSQQLPASYLSQTRVPEFLAGDIAPVVVASLFVLARAYSRAILIRGWGYDDTAIIIAGRHIEALAFSQAEPGLKLIYISRLLYLLVITACKYAFCASYLRIFREHTSRIIILCLTGFITLYTIPIFFATAFPCLPPSNVWHLATTKHCNEGPKAAALTYATGLFNVLGDILLLGFIIPQIWTLVDVSTWSSVEVNTALVCVSAPATKPLIRKVFPGVFAVSNNQSYGRETHGTISTRKTRKPQRFPLENEEEEHRLDDLGNGSYGHSLESGQFRGGKLKSTSNDSGSERYILTDTIAPVKIRGDN
ncbi:hypothetical protein N431DRAFT_457487 [Stipitochalara longipes BDJ]|nr:hypothetical protein N431DRAFT_457487 [Stipitochalara longipes BDJ]